MFSSKNSLHELHRKFFLWLQCENSPIRENTIHYLICTKTCFNRDIRKARKRQHQHPEFGHIQGEIKKKPAKKYICIQGRGETQITINFDGYLSFTLSFFFPERLHCCDIDFHCCYLYSYYNFSRTLCIKC